MLKTTCTASMKFLETFEPKRRQRKNRILKRTAIRPCYCWISQASGSLARKTSRAKRQVHSTDTSCGQTRRSYL
eukprot:9479968-Pyramimonas_sp.AAC.1